MPKATTQPVGRTPAFRKALDEASVAAGQGTPVLIHGETGAGKGVIAEYIHKASARGGRLVSLNCATLTANLFESELFGYMRGAFTGAVKDTMGLFEAAEGGTLFLDEIGDTPLELQPKLLRAIEEGVVRRVGGTKEIPVDVRLLFATNRDLRVLINAGKFREDLYYRISAFTVSLPPLRERTEDIAELARHFLEELSPSPPAISIEARETMLAYDWPGNVRELRSALAFAAAQAKDRPTILREDLPAAVRAGPQSAATTELLSHVALFRELYLGGATDARLWAEMLLALNEHLGTNRFARHEMLQCLRAVRGKEPTNNSLVNEWSRHIKPVPLRLRLIHEEGKKLRIDLNACRRVLEGSELEIEDDDTVVETLPPLPERHTRTNLDAARTTFVGRQCELQALTSLLAGGARLVTITGPGGTGKTRLSREAGTRLLGEFPGGVWFADLTESRNIDGVAYAVAQALGVPLTGAQSPELEVAAILRTRSPSMLILDNFEQVAVAASAAVSGWVAAAPSIRFIVTSRALLGIDGEHEFELQSLPLPRDGADAIELSRNEAVRLFVERARVHHVGFALDAKSARAVARICHRLEGMPLAIELAAARTVIMQPEQIADRLEKLFDLLRSTRRDLQPRQQSLTATLDWSFDLLSEVERAAFAQLSLFRGGFFLDAAEAVLDLSSFPGAPAVIDVVQSLREKSLLRAIDTRFETRFAMYELIREYAELRRDSLLTAPQVERLWRSFAEYYRAYFAEWDARTHTQDAVEALDRLDLARSNVQAAIDWAAGHAGSDTHRGLAIELTLHLYHLLRVRGPARQRVPVLQRALGLAGEGDSVQRARLLFLSSQAEREAGDPARAYELGTLAVAVAQRLNDEALIATAKFSLAGMVHGPDHAARAQALHHEVLPLFRKLGNKLNEARVLSRMALLEAESGRFEEALDYSRQSENILRQHGDLAGLAFVLSNRGTILNRQGRHAQGLDCIADAERVYRELEDRRMIALCLGNRSLINRQLRRFEEAQRLSVECLDLAREVGDRVTLAKCQMNHGILFNELGRFDDAEAAFAEALTMFEQQGNPELQAVCIENLAYIAGKRGHLDEALSGFERALAMCAGDNALDTVAGIDAAMAETLIAHGRAGDAIAPATRAVEFWKSRRSTCNRDHFRALAAQALALAENRDEGAKQPAEHALKMAGELGYTERDPSPAIPVLLTNLKKLL